MPARTAGREEGSEGVGGGGVEGKGKRQVEAQKGEENVSWPACQSMVGLWRASHGKPRMSLKCPSGMTWQVRVSVCLP